MTSSLPLPYVRDVTTAQFMAEVVERSRETPVLVDFWAPWCAPCRVLGPVLEKLAADYAGGFLLAKVDTEKEQALATQFQIRSIPTVMLFHKGTAVTGFQGALPEGQIRAFLSKQGITSATTVSPLEPALAALAAGDLELASKLLEALPAAVYGDVAAQRARAQLALRQRLVTGVHSPTVGAAIQLVLDGDREAGLAQLLDQVREEKHDEHSPARAALLEALQLIDDDTVVRDWRRKLASVLF